MTSSGLTDMIDPGEGLALDAWIDRVEDIALDHGEFEPLGPDHSAVLIESGPLLLVTFELVSDIRAQTKTDVPLGWQIAEGHGWSQLAILGHDETWFRHKAIYQYFDRLVDQGFFDNYDRVVFLGFDAGGYAAAAYSVAAPGATVLLVNPQATLDPRRTGWDDRFPHMRRAEFTSRYGFAPHMTDAADRVFLFHDPGQILDSMHASLFHGDNISHVRCRHLNGQVAQFLLRKNLLDGLVLMAMRGKLTDHVMAKALRMRRTYLPYLRRLVAELQHADRPMLAGIASRAILSRVNAPLFRQYLASAEKALAMQGRSLPKRAADRQRQLPAE